MTPVSIFPVILIVAIIPVPSDVAHDIVFIQDVLSCSVEFIICIGSLIEDRMLLLFFTTKNQTRPTIHINAMIVMNTFLFIVKNNIKSTSRYVLR